VRKPDFFIVGAGRCGTTALYEYLRAHPRIFMPVVKEPRFFAGDMPGLMNRVASLPEYLRLFRGAGPRHLAVGEASPQYMYSRSAIGNIREFEPDARLIVMLRNPVDMACSAHTECVYWFVEDEPDFEKAWRLQPLRRRGLCVPRACSQVTVLLWADMARLGLQVERLLGVFRREQVKFILFEDLARDTRAVYEDVLGFLGVPSDGRRRFPRVNESRRNRIGWLGRVLLNPPRQLVPFRRFALGTPILRRGWLLLRRLNTRNGLAHQAARIERRTLRPGFRRELVEEFRDDVERLSALIGRDLSHWHA
jgi:hypothetical protein